MQGPSRGRGEHAHSPLHEVKGRDKKSRRLLMEEEGAEQEGLKDQGLQDVSSALAQALQHSSAKPKTLTLEHASSERARYTRRLQYHARVWRESVRPEQNLMLPRSVPCCRERVRCERLRWSRASLPGY